MDERIIGEMWREMQNRIIGKISSIMASGTSPNVARHPDIDDA